MSGPEFGLAIGAVRRHAAAALTALAPYDAVLTRRWRPAAPRRRDARRRRPATDFEAQKAFTPWTSAWNVTGMPAVRCPCTRRPPAPVGVMLAARPAEEELLLALSAQVEAAAPWRTGGRPGGEPGTPSGRRVGASCTSGDAESARLVRLGGCRVGVSCSRDAYA